MLTVIYCKMSNCVRVKFSPRAAFTTRLKTILEEGLKLLFRVWQMLIAIFSVNKLNCLFNINQICIVGTLSKNKIFRRGGRLKTISKLCSRKLEEILGLAGGKLVVV